MRIFIALAFTSLVAAGACTSTAPTTEIPQARASSADCLDDLGWAHSARRGATIFRTTCAYCHRADGSGQTGGVPALARNTGLTEDPDRGIRMLLITQSAAARTHGMEYDDMVAILGELTENDLADVMNYVLSSWGNCAGPVDADRIASVAATLDAESGKR